jgi:hypothetical protein
MARGSRNAAIALAALALLMAGCQDDSDTAQKELPDAVAETRSGILSAAKSKDYDAIRPLIDLEVFLSDYGFGRGQPDPVERWRRLGPKPLETMGVLLRLGHTVRKKNEGTLYQWPRFDPNSRAEDITPAERRLLRTIMTEPEVRTLIRPEYGYTAPRLGILADGTWWFFILNRAR